MGMFDEVQSRYPLPRAQNETFQTKDLEQLVHSTPDSGGSMSLYEITEDGRLRVEKHEREWTDDPESLLGGYFRSVKKWWEELPDIHGDIRIYTSFDADDEDNDWTEFRIRFSNGRLQHIEDASAEVQRQQAVAPAPVDQVSEGLPQRIPRDHAQKVICYVVKDGRLLVFRHLDHSLEETGLQVPAGTVEKGEDPGTSAVREVQEETGVDAAVVRHLGIDTYDYSPMCFVQATRHFFLMTAEHELPDHWESLEDHPTGGGESIRYECFWIPLEQGHALAGGQSNLIGRIFEYDEAVRL